MALPLRPNRPTIYQIGAVPHAPDLTDTFDRWSRATGLGPGERPRLERLDTIPREGWWSVVRFMADNPAIWGAIVFEEKVSILTVAGELFADVTADALAVGEINAIVSTPDGLVAANCGLTAAHESVAKVTGPDYWQRNKTAELVVFGAGSRGINIALAVCHAAPDNRPAGIYIAESDLDGLERARTVLRETDIHILDLNERSAAGPARPAPGSVVVNAPIPALGKDASHVGAGFIFPSGGIVWDLDLAPQSAFSRRAHEQEADCGLRFAEGRIHYDTAINHILAEIFQINPETVDATPPVEGQSTTNGGTH
jgi:hypothetical protein